MDGYRPRIAARQEIQSYLLERAPMSTTGGGGVGLDLQELNPTAMKAAARRRMVYFMLCADFWFRLLMHTPSARLLTKGDFRD